MFSKTMIVIQVLAFVALFRSTALAVPLTFNVDGVISDSSNQPLESAGVTFRVDVQDPSGTCTLYREEFPVSMTGSNGYFSLVIGKQTNLVASGGMLDKVFSNDGSTIAGNSCTYTPASKTETRKIVVSFNDGGTQQLFSSQDIQSVPYAVEADQAHRLTTALSGDVSGTQTLTSVDKIKGVPVDVAGAANGKILKYQSGTFVIADDLMGAGLTSLNGLNAPTQIFGAIDTGNSVTAPAWSSSGSAHTLKIPMASGTGVTAGLISNTDYAMISNRITSLVGDVTASGSGAVNVAIGTGKVTSTHILDGTILANDMDFTGANSATTGLVLKDNSGKFMNFTCSTPSDVLTWTATGWTCQLPAATGITSLNGQINSTQNLAAVASGSATALSYTYAANTHTLNIPMASTASVTAGLLSKADYDSFNNRLPLAGGTMSGPIDMGSKNIINAGNITMVPGGYLTLPNTGIASTTAGQVWYDGGAIKYYDGSAVKTLGTSSGGIVSFNTLTDSTQTLAVNTTGTVPAFTSASGTHTLNIPMASNAGANAGLISNADYVSLMGKQSSSLPAGQLWVGNALGGAEARTLSGDFTIDNTGLATLKSVGTAGTYFKVVTDAQGRVTSGSALAGSDVAAALGYTPVNRAGDTMAGALNFGGNDITNSGNITMANSKYFTLSTNATNGTTAGQMWYDGGSNQIKYWNGSAAVALAASGAGITALNGSSATSQSFATPGTSGNAPDWSTNTGSGVHTLNIPMASAGSVTAGLISNADYVAFNSKQSSALSDSYVWIGNSANGAEAHALSGDATISNAGLVTVDKTQTGNALKIQQLDSSGVAKSLGIGLINSGTVRLLPGTPATASYDLKLPIVAPANNQILKSDATGSLSWVTYLAQVSDSAPLADGKMWIGNGSNIAVEQTMSGDATISNAGLLTLKPMGTAGTYTKVSTDTQGRVISGSALALVDVTTALGYTPVQPGLGAIVGTDMNFTGTNSAASSLVIKDGTGKFTTLSCSTKQVAIWTATGWACEDFNINKLSDVKYNSGDSLFLGNLSGNSLTNGTNNTGLGVAAGSQISSQNNNTAIGYFALNNINSATGDNNTAVGSHALYGNANGIKHSNTGVGMRALFDSPDAELNTAIGQYALSSNNGSSMNIGIGIYAGANSPNTSNNIFVGYAAGKAIYGNDNIMVGANVFSNNTAASSAMQNVIIGSNIAAGATGAHNASYNTIMGYNAANALTTGSSNVIMGKDAGSTLTTGDLNILIGTSATIPSPTTSKYLNIGNVIKGDLSIGGGNSGNIGIGTEPSTVKLDISSSGSISPSLRAVKDLASNAYAGFFRNSVTNTQTLLAGENYALVMTGHISSIENGVPPTASPCGSPPPTFSGTDTRGTITINQPGLTSCTVNFSRPYATGPTCIVGPASDPGTARFWVSSTTANTMNIGLSGATANLKFNYFCIE